MNIKKLVSVLIVLTLLLSLLPLSAFAQSEVTYVSSPRVEKITPRSASEAPTLASGKHQTYLDRIASLPDYAVEYYHWMEDNAVADGILADPTKGEIVEGDYGHVVTHFKGSEQFIYVSRDQMLSTAGKIAVEKLGDAFNAFGEYMGAVNDAFNRDHPEVFWLSGRSSYSYLGSWYFSVRGNICTVIFEADMVVWLKYSGYDIRDNKYLDPAKVAEGIRLRDAAVQEILAGCPEGSVYDQVVYLNDALTERNAYNSVVAGGSTAGVDSDAWECMSGLLGTNGAAGPVCEGYARAFQVLCNVKGIPSVLVDGQAKSSLNGNWEGHMWNFVQVDGSWYAVDVTWNDPFVPSKPTDKKSGMETRYWMLLGGETMVSTGLSFLASHVGTNQVRPQGLSFTNGPALNRTAYDPSAMLMYSIGGKVTSVGSGMSTVQLYRGNNLKISWNLSGSSAAYNFEGVQAGIYQVTASKAGHVTRTQEVVVTDQAVTCDMKLQLLGDVTGDGQINMGDVAKIYGHSKGVAPITDSYILQCADVTGDVRVNVADAGRLSAMMRG